MHLQRQAGRPIAITPPRPLGPGPPGIKEIDWVRHVLLSEHGSQNGQDLGFGGGVRLGIGRVGLVLDDGDEEDSGPGKERGGVEGLEERVVAPRVRVCVEEELRGGGPEYGRGGELQEDFRVGAHRHAADCGGFPARERGGEGYEGGSGGG